MIRTAPMENLGKTKNRLFYTDGNFSKHEIFSEGSYPRLKKSGTFLV